MKSKTDRDAETEEPEEVPAGETPGADETLAARCEELQTRWARAQADYQNLRRRAQADFEAGIKGRMQPLLDELLLVLDYLDMALASPAETEEAANLRTGVELTRAKLWQALEREEIEPVPTDGPFDPTVHEAVRTVAEGDAAPGTIVETVRRGYTWRGEVVRHAHVVVVAEPSED